MAAHNIPRQQNMLLQNPLIPIQLTSGPSPYYSPPVQAFHYSLPVPVPAPEQPSPVEARLHQLHGMPRSEICKVPIAELVHLRNYKLAQLNEYETRASLLLFGSAGELHRCAMLRGEITSTFDEWLHLATLYADDEEFSRTLQSGELAEQRFPAIFDWLEVVERAGFGGLLMETDDGDADLQAYRAEKGGFGVPVAAASMAKKTTRKPAEKQNKITKPTTKCQKQRKQTKYEALRASLMANIPKGNGSGMHSN